MLSLEVKEILNVIFEKKKHTLSCFFKFSNTRPLSLVSQFGHKHDFPLPQLFPFYIILSLCLVKLNTLL